MIPATIPLVIITFPVVRWGCPERIGNNSGKIDNCILSQCICLFLIIGEPQYMGFP